MPTPNNTRAQQLGDAWRAATKATRRAEINPTSAYSLAAFAAWRAFDRLAREIYPEQFEIEIRKAAE